MIQGNRGVTRLSLFGLGGALMRGGGDLTRTALRVRSILVKRKCTPSGLGIVPTSILRLTGMGDKCRRDGTRCRSTRCSVRRTALATPFSKIVTGLFRGECGVPGASRPFYQMVGAKGVRISFAMLRGRLPLLGIKSGIRVAPCTSTTNMQRKDVDRVGPLISRGKVMHMGTQIGNDGGLFSNVGMEMDIGHSINRRLIVPGATIMLHSNGRIMFALGRNGTV